MKKLHPVLFGVLICIGSAGCADFEASNDSFYESEARAQAIMVTPEFSIHGLKNMPEGLYLTELGLSISEIRFQPVMTGSSNIAYSTSEPFQLFFDVENDVEVKRLEPIEFPATGRFVVSIRLEAHEHEHVTTGSLSLAGLVASEGSTRIDPRESSDGKFDGNPLPLPFDEKREDDADEKSWTPFRYNSKRAVFYTFSDVELVPGEQTLSFNFDIHDWAGEMIEPITRAVKNLASPDLNDARGVDVTVQLDSVGWGAEALMDGASVRTEPIHTEPTGRKGR